MSTENTTPSESSRSAAENALASLMGTTNSEKVEVTNDDETTLETSSEETIETENTEPASDENLEAAKVLLSAINSGGKTAQDTLQMLATKLGLKAEFKENPQETIKTLKEYLDEELGEEYGLISEKIANALDKYDKTRFGKIDAKFSEMEAKEVRNAVNAESNAAAKELQKFGDFEKLEPKMLEMSKKIRPEPGMTPTEYIQVLYKGSGGNSKLKVSPNTNSPSNKRVTSPTLDRGPQPQPQVADAEITTIKQATTKAFEQLMSSNSLKN